MSVTARIYARAPVWMQNLLISAYGARLRRMRYGPIGRQTLAMLRASRSASLGELRREQLRTLNEVLARAAADVPFYRERKVYSAEITSLDQLRTLPLLEKSELQAAGRAMISDRYRDQRLIEIHTGGTTGKPLAIFCDRATLQRNYAFFDFFRETAGISGRARTATFAGRTIVAPDAGPPYWRHNRAANTLLFSSYHIAPNTLPDYVEALRGFQPELIDSYPSSVEPIARYLVANGVTDLHPKAVITSSETLFPPVRATIERAFGCKVFDHYGSAEMAALITQCAAGSYHVDLRFGIVELLDDGRPVRAGERGEIVASGFINPVMPLIRYRMGDFAVRGTDACPCGRAGDTIERIEGRIDDVITTPDGKMIGRLDPIFKSVASLYETRIVQDAPDHLRVELVASNEFTPAMERELEAQLRARIGSSMRVDFVRVPSIERSAAGKLRTTVNLVRRRADSAAVAQGPPES